MKFVITGKGEAHFAEEASPRPRAGELLCECLTVGLCGTDRLVFAGEMPSVTYPRVPCHEVVARVLEDGSTRGLAAGAMVAIDPYKNCGACHACRTGRPNCCRSNQTLGVQRDGILRERFVIAADRAYAVPESADLRLFCLAEPLALALHIVGRAGEVRGRWCMVVGAGNVGGLVIRVLRAQGARVIACDIAPKQLREAAALGAELCVNPRDANADGQVLEATGQDGVAVAFETSGGQGAVETCLRLAAFAGRVVLVGHSRHACNFAPTEFVFKELEVVGSRNSFGQFPRAIEMLAAEPERWRSLISHRFDFEHSPDAFRLTQQADRGYAKIVIDFAG